MTVWWCKNVTTATFPCICQWSLPWPDHRNGTDKHTGLDPGPLTDIDDKMWLSMNLRSRLPNPLPATNQYLSHHIAGKNSRKHENIQLFKPNVVLHTLMFSWISFTLVPCSTTRAAEIPWTSPIHSIITDIQKLIACNIHNCIWLHLQWRPISLELDPNEWSKRFQLMCSLTLKQQVHDA